MSLSGAQKGYQRYPGGKRIRHGYRKYVTVTADMAAPTVAGAGVAPPQTQLVRWAIPLPSGVTSFTVSLYRWVEPVDAQGNSVGTGFWQLDSSTAGISADWSGTQYVDGDRLALRVHSLVFAVGAVPVTVYQKGVNRGV